LFAPSDVKMTLTVEAAQIARTKPAVSGEGFAIRFRVLIIARHDNRTANEHFADAFAVRLINLDLDIIERRAHGADFIILKACDGCGPRCLRQSVALEQGEAEAMKIARHVGIET